MNDHQSDVEKELRVKLAACYRIFDNMGWSEMIFNHITVKIPGESDAFLINPYGLLYSEVTASNLVKVDISGNILEPTQYKVNPAGMLIHSTIHEARPDAHCIAHTHTNAGMAVACQQDGLRIDNFYSVLLHNRVAYHDFEGITVMDGEKEKLVQNLGDKNFAILRSHGLLTCGNSIPAAFANMWVLQRACEVQMEADATGRPLIRVSEAIGDMTERLLSIQTAGAEWGELEFNAMVRKIDKIDPSYKE
ncbi:class II aldolase [Gammaproteobacteria bacterium 45_16_T64]|nr:class II aldolase [Gammaproteobacteria bacterium 45_16_T64]